MSRAARHELDQYEQSEAAFHRLALFKKWICKLCLQTPSREELDAFTDNGGICLHCQASYERFMRN